MTVKFAARWLNLNKDKNPHTCINELCMVSPEFRNFKELSRKLGLMFNLFCEKASRLISQILWISFWFLRPAPEVPKENDLKYENNLVFLRGQNRKLKSEESEIDLDQENDMWILLASEVGTKLGCNKVLIWIDNMDRKSPVPKTFITNRSKTNTQVILRISGICDFPIKKTKYLFIRGANPCYDKIIRRLEPKHCFFYSADIKPLPLFWWTKVDTIFFDTAAQKTMIKKKIPTVKTVWMRKCVNERVFHPPFKKSTQKKFDIIFIGSHNRAMWEKKRMDWFFSSLYEYKNQLSIAIIGTVDKEKVVSLHRDNWSIFSTFNRVSPEQVYGYLSDSRCLAVFSKVSGFHSFPRVILEAMASDVPILVDENIGLDRQRVCPPNVGRIIDSKEELLSFTIQLLSGKMDQFQPTKYYQQNFSLSKVGEYMAKNIIHGKR